MTRSRRSSPKAALFLGITVAALATGCSGYDRYDATAAVDSHTSPAQPKVDTAVRQQLSNNDAEITRLQSRIEQLEDMVSSLNKNDRVESVASAAEARSTTLRDDVTKLSRDLTALKEKSNETAKVLNTTVTKVAAIEETGAKSSASIENLQTAMRSLVDVMKPSVAPSAVASDGDTYKVKAGDSLGKIAKDHNTSIQALMELNGLAKDDFIRVGQQLRVPR